MVSRTDQFAELIDRVVAADLEDYGSFQIDAFTGSEQQIDIECEVKLDESPDFPSAWRIRCKGVKKSLLKLGYFDRISVESKHVLLTEYQEDEFRLGFRGKAEEPLAVLGALYNAHRYLAKDWIPFSSYFGNREVLGLIKGGFGTLAEGPESFVDAYAEVLRSFNIDTRISGGKTPAEWNGSEFRQFRNLRALLLNECFVVAEDFDASKI